MRVSFINFYNQYAFGARCLAAVADRAGHDCLLINLKRFHSRPVARDNAHERAAILEGGHLPVFEIHPQFDIACPYPVPVSATEQELLLARLEHFEPEVLAFSLTSSHLPVVQMVSELLRRRFPRVPQIWGGIHPTMAPQGCLRYADVVCIGEGDEALLDYLADPWRTNIANLHFKDRQGAYITNPNRPLLRDLDSLPLPFYDDQREFLIDQDREWALADLEPREQADQIVLSSQRGCPFSCSYCLHGNLRDMYRGQKYLRRKSVDVFLAEIETRLRRFPVATLNFWDDIFMIHPDWIEEFCDKYPRRIGRPFGGYGHPRTTTLAMLKQLKQAGCSYISLGLQSGSPYISKDVYGRSVTNERFVEFGRMLQEAGFENIVYEILSRCPFEREEDLRATVHLLAQLPHACKVSVKHLVFFPFTRINDLTLPRVNLPPALYHFYEMLYVLAGQPGFEPHLLDQLVNDPYLREHPRLIEQWASQLAVASEANQQLRAEVVELEKRMPWGIRRATAHLLHQVGRRLLPQHF